MAIALSCQRFGPFRIEPGPVSGSEWVLTSFPSFRLFSSILILYYSCLVLENQTNTEFLHLQVPILPEEQRGPIDHLYLHTRGVVQVIVKAAEGLDIHTKNGFVRVLLQTSASNSLYTKVGDTLAPSAGISAHREGAHTLVSMWCLPESRFCSFFCTFTAQQRCCSVMAHFLWTMLSMTLELREGAIVGTQAMCCEPEFSVILSVGSARLSSRQGWSALFEGSRALPGINSQIVYLFGVYWDNPCTMNCDLRTVHVSTFCSLWFP